MAGPLALLGALTDIFLDVDLGRVLAKKAKPASLLVPVGTGTGEKRGPGLVVEAKFAGERGWHAAVVLAAEDKTLYLARLVDDPAGPIEIPVPRTQPRRVSVPPGIWTVPAASVGTSSVMISPQMLTDVGRLAAGSAAS